MSFASPLMALGAAAFLIPLVIHLLFRSRYRAMDWGAMFLLRDVVQANRRRMQWHQWILLLLRCAIPILIALAMARPLVSSVQSMAGGQPVSLILMIDDSRSMSAGSRATRAAGGVTELLDSMSARDEVIVIPASEAAGAVSTGSPQDARLKLREIRYDGGPASLTTMMQSAVAACRAASHPYKRIVVVSDFGENVLRSADGSLLSVMDSVGERLEQFTPRPQLDFLDISQTDGDAASLANVVVESIQTDVPAVLVGRPVPMTASVRNDSDLPVPGMRASWIVDGRVLETQTVSLEPRGTARLNWRTTFEKPGGASVAFTIEHTDAVSSDNRRTWAVEVMQPIRVWLVDGQPSGEPLQSETDFLQVALSPFAFRATERDRRLGARRGRAGETRQEDLVTTRVLTPKAFLKEITANDDMSEYPDLVVLANLDEPPGQSDSDAPDSDAPDSDDPNAVDPVARHRASGGHVLFFDGDLVDAEAWQSCDWLPATPGEIVDSEGTPFRIEPPGTRLEAWKTLGSAEDSLFDSVEVTRRRGLTMPSDAGSVLLRTEAGEALVVMAESIAGDANGRVVQFAISCDTAWSNLPLRPVFLPMIQQLVLDMVGSDRQGSDLPVTRWVIRPNRGQNQSTNEEGTDTAVWQVTPPDGKTKPTSVSVSEALVFAETRRPGVYRFSEKSGAAVSGNGTPSDNRSVVRVIDVPASESVLRGVAPELLAECSQRLQATSYGDSATLTAAAQRERFGMEIWRPLLWLLLAVMVGEVLWQQLGGMRSGAAMKPARSGVVS